MIKPTESELEILQVLWNNQPSSVREINDQLNEVREVGYTTTLKIMQIMFEKGLVTRNTDQRSHLYSAVLREGETKRSLLQEFITNTFKGSTKELVLSALGNSESTPEELEEIKELILRIENQDK